MRFIDTIQLRGFHTLILGHKPTGITELIMNDKYAGEGSILDTSAFGLFDTAQPNYNTYYPELKVEDLNPKDEEFGYPVFRMLSATYIRKGGTVISFKKPGVLKNSMNLALGITINIEHEMMIANAVGSISSVIWQNAYTDKNGNKIPAGLNGVYKIDGKSNPRILRGIMMDPPSIHSTSVTVMYAWEKSHTKMEDQDFWSKMGTEVDGQLVAKVATEILLYPEVSLVGMGADPFAKKLGGDGKILNTDTSAKRVVMGFSSKLPESNIYALNYKKAMDEHEIMESISLNADNNTNINLIENNMDYSTLLLALGITHTGELKDDAAFAAIVTAHFKVTPPDKYPTLTEKFGTMSDADIVADLTTMAAYKKLGTVEEVTTKLSQLPMATKGEERLTELRNETIANYKLITPTDKQDAKHIESLEKADFAAITPLHKTYKDQVNEKLPFICTDCNSTNVSRRTSLAIDPNAPVVTTPKSTNDTIISLRAKHNKPKKFFLHSDKEGTKE